MPSISRIGIALTFLAAALPFAVSTAVGSRDCSQNEFWYSPNKCCLPYGGPPSPPPPPKGDKCPSSHYWGETQGCCVPSHPPPAHSPPPQCPKNWDWNPTLRKCVVTPTPPSSPPSGPSGYPGYGHGGGNGNGQNGDGDGHGQGGYSGQSGPGSGQDGQNGHNYKRSAHPKAPSTPLCPAGLDACPITSVRNGDYECLDTATELESCGGCSSLGNGQDCTAILGAWNVGCEQGHCAVYTCAGGFERALDGKSCVALK